MQSYNLILFLIFSVNNETLLGKRRQLTSPLGFAIPTTCQAIFNNSTIVLNNESLAPGLDTHPNLVWKRTWSLLQNYNVLKITAEVAVDDTLTMRQYKIENDLSEPEQFSMAFSSSSITYSEDLVIMPNQCIGTVDDLESVDSIFDFYGFLEQPVPVLQSCIKYRLEFKMYFTGNNDGSGNAEVEALIDLQPINTCPSPVTFDPLFDLVIVGHQNSTI